VSCSSGLEETSWSGCEWTVNPRTTTLAASCRELQSITSTVRRRSLGGRHAASNEPRRTHGRTTPRSPATALLLLLLLAAPSSATASAASVVDAWCSRTSQYDLFKSCSSCLLVTSRLNASPSVDFQLVLNRGILRLRYTHR